MRPKNLGGLGIVDLERFVRALQIRWMWFQWRDQDRAWTGLDSPCTKEDRDFFHASTSVTVGNGALASFWLSNWINGTAARSIAPNLFAKSKRKNIKVQKALIGNRWISLISPVSGATEIKEFVGLWEAIHEIHIKNDGVDEIRWCWTSDGEYSAKSAYLAQFNGTKNCTFTKVVWSWLSSWYILSSLPTLDQCSSVYGWWRKCRLKVEKNARKDFDGFCVYFWWEIWKERNRRIFQGLEKSEIEVADIVKEDFNMQSASSWF
ncbi:hypothetical protein BS78_08G173700 [Paspalum vaginatum]|nr:hypothetical protein BS78_08G173700 [Paspalum vaginatum]